MQGPLGLAVAACGIAQFGRAIICNRGHDRCAMSNDRVTQPDGNVQARLAVPCAVRCDVPAHEGAGARQGEAAGFQMRVPHRPRVNHVRPDFERDRHVGEPAAPTKRTESSISVSSEPT